MWKYLSSFIWNEKATDLSLDEAYAVLSSPQEELEESSNLNNDADAVEYNCHHKNGIITYADKDLGEYIIDDIYKFQSNLINIHLGTKVAYTVYIADEKLNVCNISILDSEWDDDRDEKLMWCTRSLIAKVTKRDGRNIHISPNDIVINLNDVASEFVPIVGDWIDLEVKVELDEKVTDLCGKILRVDHIRPLRTRLVEGCVKKWNLQNLDGVINRDIVFNKDALTTGYLPLVGDFVAVEAIECEQVYYTWRALKIIPLQNRSVQKIVHNEHEVNINLDDSVVFVSDNVFISAKKLYEEIEFVLEVKNNSESSKTLVNYFIDSKKPQCRIVSPLHKNIIIEPTNTVKCVGICTTRNIGTTKELVTFQFENLTISRWIIVNVEPYDIVKEPSSKTFENKMEVISKYKNFKHHDVIKGQRLVLPPRFVSIRLPEYPVPEKLWDIICKFSDQRCIVEVTDSLQSIKPCLTQNLRFNTYEEFFHSLVHFEEIYNIMAVRKYDQDRVCFVKNGEYMMLEIDNLSEKRPSLILGDKILAKDPYKSDNLILEGFIHKVGAKHIFVKFASSVHDSYDGEDLEIKIVQSRNNFRRMHQAIGLAVRHLAQSFLFPNSVVAKKPQINFEFDKYDKYDDNLIFNELKQTVSVNQVLELTETHCNNSNETSRSSLDKFFNSYNMRLKTNQHTEKEQSVKTNKHKAILSALIRDSTLETHEQTTASTDSTKKCEEEDISLTNKSKLLLGPPNKENFHSNKKKIGKNNFVKGPQKCYTANNNMLKLEWINKNLNYYQKEAVRHILLGEARPLPFIIYGPPGTGKTITLIETVLQLLRLIPDSRILVATPSNSSADLLALRLIESNLIKPGDLVRLVAFRCVQDNMLPIKLVPYCATADIAREGTHQRLSTVTDNGLTIGCNSSVLGRHRITVGTCCALAPLFNMGFKKGHFTHIIVDEAGQATEPEIMIPLTFLDIKSDQVVLAGDPMQLGPVVLSVLASKFGLQESYLERLLNRFPYIRDTEGFPETGYDPRLVARLIYNYRSLPEILSISSKLFYHNELIPTISQNSNQAKFLDKIKEILPHRTQGPPSVVFHGVKGENYQTADCPSWFNPNEASQIFYYINELYRLGVSSSDIGVISPYLKQVKQIRSLLSEAEFEIPKIGTVEEFQGQEFNVILITTVRSNKNLIPTDILYCIGFLSNPRRLNVALTRAKTVTIIVGNPHLLYNDVHWRSVINFCIENNGYCGYELESS